MAAARRADPGSWQIDADVAGGFANIFVYARAKAAAAIGKPWILEETGMMVRARGPACGIAGTGFCTMQLHAPSFTITKRTTLASTGLYLKGWHAL